MAESGDNIQYHRHNPLNVAINGKVMKVQNGQQGPATSMGEPLLVSQRKNMVPTRREQQQNREWQSSDVPVQNRFLWSFSACCRSHCVDTAYCFLVVVVSILYEL